MARGRSDNFADIFRLQKAMSTQIVAKAENIDYSRYAGGTYETALTMAKVDFTIKENILPESFTPLLKLFLSYLDQKRKAEFSSVGTTEVSKLGFILGVTHERRSGTSNLPWRQ